MSELSANAAPHFPALATPAALRAHLRDLDVEFPVADRPFVGGRATVGSAIEMAGVHLKNRVASLPMQGRDATSEGEPSAATLARWAETGRSGASLLWGETLAVSESARAHGNQLLPHAEGLSRLSDAARNAHRSVWGDERGCLFGIQLGHAGRWARNEANQPAPRPVFRHPLLDPLSGVDETLPLITDLELEGVGEELVRAANLAWNSGFDLIDLDHSNGELLNEVLAAQTRTGRYGGSLGARTRLLRRVVSGIRAEAPGLLITVRLNLFDSLPTAPPLPGDSGTAQWDARAEPFLYGFGVDPENPHQPDLSEPLEVVSLLRALGVRIIGAAGGSSHYCPLISAPCPEPGLEQEVPEPPWVGVARHLNSAHYLKTRFPDLLCIGSGYDSLTPMRAHIVSAVVERQWIDMIGLSSSAETGSDAIRELIGTPPPKS